MSIAYDLPGCMSDTRELDDSRDGSVPCSEATSRFKRIIASPSTSFRRTLALAIPAALLAGMAFPLARPSQQETATVAPAPVTYTVRKDPAASVEMASSNTVVAQVDLTLGQPQLSSTGTTTVWLNLRAGPSLQHGIITTLAPGTQVTIHSQQDGWYKVSTPYGTGWVYGAYLQVGGNSASVSSNSFNSDVAQIAMSLVGSPYAYGGTGPYAFDCSGLTQYVYRQVGVYLPHSASMQFSSAYGQILGSMSQLQPGDLVFFAGTYAAPGITHAGVYVGNGMMVSAGTPQTGVRLENIYAAYWASKWVGGLRVYR
jgi:cell wall-associated NlpC family hydrolase